MPDPPVLTEAWPAWAPGNCDGSLQGQKEKRAFISGNNFFPQNLGLGIRLELGEKSASQPCTRPKGVLEAEAADLALLL